MSRVLAVLAVLAVIGVGGCATTRPIDPGAAVASRPAPQAVLRALALDPALEERILALDPGRITETDVRMTLAAGPTPRIMNLHGGIYPVHLVMESFSRFLISMGYPEAKLRHPQDGRLSHSPYEPSARIAGAVAWYYEREGMMPMLVGHSQGGIQAVKVLYELAGAHGDHVRVWNAATDEAEERFTITDPLSGRERPVVGLKIGYVSVVGAGGAALLLPNQWGMAGRLRTIPDSVEEFTGYALGVDLLAWDFSGNDVTNPYKTNGSAKVRNVRLPAEYSHVTVAAVSPLAGDQEMRDWLHAYAPGEVNGVPAGRERTDDGALWAADVWYSIKRHWALEAQQLIRARRALAKEQ